MVEIQLAQAMIDGAAVRVKETVTDHISVPIEGSAKKLGTNRLCVLVTITLFLSSHFVSDFLYSKVKGSEKKREKAPPMT